MPITTLRDLEKNSGPTSSAFPNAWANSQQQQSLNPRNANYVSSVGGQVGVGGSVAVDLGYRHVTVSQEEFNNRPVSTMCKLNFCPCLMDNPCSPENLNAFLQSFKKASMIIIVIDIIVFIVEMSIGNYTTQNGISSSALITLQAKYVPAILKGQVWRFIIPVFLHGGLLHIFFNMFFQFQITVKKEYEIGTPKWLALYFASAFFGNLTSCLASPLTISVGASSALFGFIGADISESAILWHQYTPQVKYQKAMFWILFLVISFSMGFDSATIDRFIHFIY